MKRSAIDYADAPLKAGGMAASQFVLVVALTGASMSAQTTHWTMTGRVVAAEDATPLAGCTVTADGLQATGYPLGWSWLDWRNPQPITTDADGRFTFTLPAQPSRGLNDGYPSRIHLIIKASGRVGVFGARNLSTFFDQSAQDLGDFGLPRGATPTIRVVDTNGVPQRHVQVTMRPSPTAETAHTSTGFSLRRWQQASTDDDGRVQLGHALMPGTYDLTISHRELFDPPPSLVIPDPLVDMPDIQIEVKPPSPAATAAGRVVDADGKAVEGYVLYAEGALTNDGKRATVTARSDAQGAFELIAAGLRVAGAFELKHPRNNRYDDWHTFGNHPWGKRDLVVTLERAAAMELRVTTKGRQPIDYVAVHLVPANSSVLGADPERMTGRLVDGRLRVEGLRVGRYFVRVHAQGTPLWPSDWIECEAAPKETQPVHVELSAPITRTIHVFTGEGRPVAGCSVDLLYGLRERIAAKAELPGVFRDHGIVDRTMTGAGPEKEEEAVVFADRGIADISGKIMLSGRSTDTPVCLRVRGGGAQDTLHELPSWTDGRAAILVTVAAGGAVTGRVSPTDFATRHQVSTERERKQHAEWSLGPNPWMRSRADLLARSCPGIALRPAGEPPLWTNLVVPVGNDGSFAIDGVPPGDYEIVLVMRRGIDDRVRDDIIDPPLARVRIVAGATQRLSLTIPDDVK